MNEELKIFITAQIDDLKKSLEEAQKETQKTAKEGTSNFKKFGEAAKSAGKVIGTAMKAAAAALAAAGTALVALTESTREYRTEQAKLVSAFESAGSSAEQAKETYNDLYRVLGDSGQATEAASHLAQLTKNEQDLAEWTNICQGVYATFGDSLPIESLTEASNETAKTGALTGGLADALNWAGVAEEEFQAKLDACNTEAEREALIRETLNGIYSDAATNYEKNAAGILAANEAQAKLTDGLAALGAAAEPIVAVFKSFAGDLLQSLVPGISLVSEGIQEVINGVDGGAEKIQEGISSMVNSVITTITNMLPTLLSVGVNIITSLLEGIVAAFPTIINALITLLPQIITTIMTLIPQITGAIINALPLLLDTLLQVVSSIIVELGVLLPTIVKQIVAIIPQLISIIIDNIPLLLDAAITFLMAIVDAVPEIIPPLIDALPTVISKLISTLIQNIPKVIEAAVKLFMGIVSAIPKIIPSLINALGSLIGKALKSIGGLFKDVGKVIGDALGGTVKKAINGVLSTAIKIINGFISAINLAIGVINLIPGVNIKKLKTLEVPQLAKGGIATGDTLAHIGEDGYREAVLPLDRNTEWMDDLANKIASRNNTPSKIVLMLDGKELGWANIHSINNITKQTGQLQLVW